MPDNDFGPSTQQFDNTAPTDALPAGSRLGGYQIIDVLGRSRFGIVYLALDSSLQRQVAIKEYLPVDLALRHQGTEVGPRAAGAGEAFADGLAAFLAEAKLLAGLDHAALAHVHSFWEGNGTAYMVMPYYSGYTLAETLATMRHPPDEAWLRNLLTPLLSALNVLHSAQCCHRNISPENIFVRSDGRPVLLDFAASTLVLGDKTLPLSKLLNPGYAPIEQYSGSATLPQGPWSDLYALASVLHFAITGEPPLQATQRATHDMQRSLAHTVRDLQARFPALHYRYNPAFLAGIDKALSVMPRNRPRDVADFQKWLDHTPQPPAASAAPRSEPPPPPRPAATPARPEPVTPKPSPSPTPSAPAVRTPARRRAPLWVTALCVTALAALGGWWWLQTQPLAPAPLATAPQAPAVTPASAPALAPPTPPAEPAASAALPPPTTALPATSEAIAAPVELPAPPPAASAVPMPASPTASEVPAAEPPPAPTRSKKAAQAVPPAEAEANSPRAVCGTRSNFSLYNCMQSQCKRSRFAQHPQCIEFRQRSE